MLGSSQRVVSARARTLRDAAGHRLLVSGYSARGALGRSYSERVYFRKLHHALRMCRSTSMDRSLLLRLRFPQVYELVRLVVHLARVSRNIGVTLNSSMYTLYIILQVQICSLWNLSTCLQAIITTRSCDLVPLNKIYYFLRFARFRPELEIVKSNKSSCLATCDISKAFSKIEWYQPVQRPKSVNEGRTWGK